MSIHSCDCLRKLGLFDFQVLPNETACLTAQYWHWVVQELGFKS